MIGRFWARLWLAWMLAWLLVATGAVPARAEPVSLMQVAIFQAGAPLAPGAASRPLDGPAVMPLIRMRAEPDADAGAEPAFGPGFASGGGLGDVAENNPGNGPESGPGNVPEAGMRAGPDAGPSLFVGRRAGGLFVLVAPRLSRPGTLARSRAEGRVARIRALIGWAEAGAAGYDAVQWGARIKPPKRPTEMTLGEIFAWIEATPGQPHAIGYYQFIPATLARLVRRLDLGPEARFTPALQDRLGDVLLAEAGLGALERGEIGRIRFMNNLAKIWAGLPNSSGKSHYEGFAGNKAVISWELFDREMARIFPG